MSDLKSVFPSRPRDVRAGIRYTLSVAIAFGVLLALAGATFASGSAVAAKPVLRIGQLAGFGMMTLDPAKDGQTFDVSRSLVYEQIIRPNADGTYRPGLAATWRYVGRGNKTFEFTLRHNARFSDGSPVTAQAVTAWFGYFMKVSRYASQLGPNPTFTPVGRWTVRIRVTIPNPTLPFLLSQNNFGAVAGPKAVASPDSLATSTDGAGPYMLDPSQSLSGDHYTYVPNPNYYDKSTLKFSKVVVKIFSNTTTLLQAIQAGQFDIVNGGDAATAPAAARSGLKVIYGPSGVAGLIILDRNGALAKPLGDVRVRQALNYAIDRKTITSALMGAYATPTSEWTTTDGFDPKYQNYYAYNPTKAKALLKAAGYPDGFTLTVADYDGIGNIGAPLTQAVAQYLQAVGVKLNIQTLTQAQLRAQVFGRQVPAYTQPWSTMPMSQTVSLSFLPTAPANPFHTNDPTLNKLFYKGLRSANASAQWRAISQRLTDQAFNLPVFAYPNFYYVSKHVGGVAITASRPFAPAADWFWK